MIRPLLCPEEIEHLRNTSREEGFHFLDRLFEEWQNETNRFERPGETLLVVEQGGQIVATGGITRQSDALGRVRRVYVSPSFRRHGIATELLKTLIDHAATHFTELVLWTDQAAADNLYLQLGFLPAEPNNSDYATHRLPLK